MVRKLNWQMLWMVILWFVFRWRVTFQIYTYNFIKGLRKKVNSWWVEAWLVKVSPKLIHQWDWYSFIIIFFSAGWFGKVCFKSLPWTSSSSPRTWNIRIPCKLSKFFPLQWIAIRYVVFCMSKMLVCDVAGVRGSAETRQRIGALPTPRFCTLYKSRQMFSYQHWVFWKTLHTEGDLS